MTVPGAHHRRKLTLALSLSLALAATACTAGGGSPSTPAGPPNSTIESPSAAAAATIPPTSTPPTVGGTSNASPAAAPPGTLVWSRVDPGHGSAIFVGNADGTDVRRVPMRFAAEGYGGAVWSPDGTRLLITNLENVPGPAVVRPDGSSFTRLDASTPRMDFCSAWSPDGKRVLCKFDGDRKNAPGLFTIRSSDGGGAIRITTYPFERGDPNDLPGSYSPDGTMIAFQRRLPDRVGGMAAIFVARADGSDAHRITAYGVSDHRDLGLARWSPDGTEILFAGEDGSIDVIHPDGTGLRSIALPGDLAAASATAPSWSPDGGRIVVTLQSASTGLNDLSTIRPDGSDPVMVTSTPVDENFGDWEPQPA